MKLSVILFCLILKLNLLSQGLEVWGAGINDFGQLGNGNIFSKEQTDTLLTTQDWLKISSGNTHSFGIKIDGTLWGWGGNDYGQLGDGTSYKRLNPTRVKSEGKWNVVSCGDNHTIGIKSDGTLWAWGANDYGQLGNGRTSRELYPVKIGNDSNWIAVSAGGNHNLALKSDFSLWAWGNNDFGQLGNSSLKLVLTPKRVGSENNWIKITSGFYHSLAIKNDNSLWGWGNNRYGQLGIGDTNVVSIKSPIQIGNEFEWKEVSSRYLHTAAIKFDGTIWQWGFNEFCQTGFPSRISVSSPFQTNLDYDWKFVVTTAHNTIGIKDNKSMWAIGCNSARHIGANNVSLEYTNTFVNISKTKDWNYACGGFHYFIATKGNISIIAELESDKEEICLNDSIHFRANVLSGNLPYKYKWTPSNLLTNDTIANPIAFPNKSTVFYLEVTDSLKQKMQLLKYIVVHNNLNIKINAKDSICAGELLVAKASGGKNYKWYIDSISSKSYLSNAVTLELRPEKSLVIILEGESYNCFAYDTLKINVFKVEKPEIGYYKSSKICEGDSVALFVRNKQPNTKYKWQYSSSIIEKDTIIAKKIDTYRLIASNLDYDKCVAYSEIPIDRSLVSKIKIIGSSEICEYDSTLLQLSKYELDTDYIWNDGTISKTKLVKSAGFYWCKALNNNCLEADTIEIKQNLAPKINIDGDSLLCKNNINQITLVGDFTSCTWNTGETRASIFVSKEGVYSVSAVSITGCVSSASINVINIKNSIDYSKISNIDFGSVLVKNKLSKSIEIPDTLFSRIYLKHNDKFSITTKDNLFLVNFYTDKLGTFEDSLYFEIENPCKEILSIKISAQADREQIISIKVADIVAQIGEDNVKIPVTYKVNENVSLPQTINWNAKLKYSNNIYYPNIINHTQFVEMAEDSMEISLAGSVTLNNSTDTLSIITGKTYLADTTFTNLVLSEFKIDTNFRIIKLNGSLQLDGFCAQNIRNIEYFIPNSIRVNPNPSDGDLEIEIESEYEGMVHFELVNLTGNVLFTDSKLKNEKKIKYQYNNLNLPDGLYLLKFNLGISVLKTNVIIAK